MKIKINPSRGFINRLSKQVNHSSFRSQTKKELIKKMSELTKNTSKENLELKLSTPVKLPRFLTPRKTPRSNIYFSIPSKKTCSYGEKSPFMEMGDKEFITSSFIKNTPVLTKQNFEKESINDSNSSWNWNETFTEEIIPKIPNSPLSVKETLKCFQQYNMKVRDIYEKRKIFTDTLLQNIDNIPVCSVEREFLQYEEEKKKLQNQLEVLKGELQTALKNKEPFHKRLKNYVKEEQQLFEKELKLHNAFEIKVQSAVEEYEKIEKINDNLLEVSRSSDTFNEEQPKLRRSLRLSEFSRDSKNVYLTPCKKELRNFDTKAKVVRRSKSNRDLGKKKEIK